MDAFGATKLVKLTCFVADVNLFEPMCPFVLQSVAICAKTAVLSTIDAKAAETTAMA